VAAFAVGAICLGAALLGRGSEREATRDCREWIAARDFAPQTAKALVSRMQRAFGAPGVAVTIAAGGNTWSETCGFADRGRRLRLAVPFVRRVLRGRV
jgi:hypothetical protein